MCRAPVTLGGGIAMTNGSPSPFGRKKPASSHLVQPRSAVAPQVTPLAVSKQMHCHAPAVEPLLRREVVEVLCKLLGALARNGDVCACVRVGKIR